MNTAVINGYEIVEHIDIVGNYSTKTIEVNRIKWGEKASVKVDIRNWGTKDGIRVPYKGICLTDNEARRLRDILNTMYSEPWKEVKERNEHE